MNATTASICAGDSTAPNAGSWVSPAVSHAANSAGVRRSVSRLTGNA